MDLRVEGHLLAAPAVVSRQPSLVTGLARNVAAGEEEVGHGVHVAVGDDVAAGCLDGFDRRLGREHREYVEWGEDPALVGTVGVHIDHERWATGTAARCGDGGDDGRDATGVVPVPVRQEQHVDAREVDGQALGVGEPDVAVRTDVEEHRCRTFAPCRAVARAEKP